MVFSVALDGQGVEHEYGEPEVVDCFYLLERRGCGGEEGGCDDVGEAVDTVDQCHVCLNTSHDDVLVE